MSARTDEKRLLLVRSEPYCGASSAFVILFTVAGRTSNRVEAWRSSRFSEYLWTCREARHHSLGVLGSKHYRGLGDKDPLSVGETPDTRLTSDAYDEMAVLVGTRRISPGKGDRDER